MKLRGTEPLVSKCLIGNGFTAVSQRQEADIASRFKRRAEPAIDILRGLGVILKDEREADLAEPSHVRDRAALTQINDSWLPLGTLTSVWLLRHAAMPSLVAQTIEGSIAMPSLAFPIAMPFARSVAVAALMGATMLATPLTAARADSATNAPIQLAQAPNTQTPAAKGATQGEGATVEQRITDLHTALKITPDQEALWKGVAGDMRENAVAMDKLVAATKATPPKTAVDDLKTYQNFTQAHLDGLKNLLSHFEALYAAMPDAQKKIADDVFRSTRNPPAAPNK